ncbi:MAG: ADP-dependent glucokinase/phosphofructokinase [Candidatus Heimdallarchaeaceae archaeon]
MKKWVDLYHSVQDKISNFSKDTKGVLLGFNVNVDKIIKISPINFDTFLVSLSEQSISDIINNPPKTISTVEELIGSLVHAIEEGKADERLVIKKEVGDWIEKTFQVEKVTIGGQAGIMANFLAQMGLENIVLSLPVNDRRFVKLLNPAIKYATKQKKQYNIVSISQISDVTEEHFSHYIFEFQKGNYHFLGYSFECPRSNRFIASLDSVNSLLTVTYDFIVYTCKKIKDYSLAVLSGFHLANLSLSKKISFSDILLPIIKLVKEWKKNNPSFVIHIELAAVKDKELLQTIVNDLFSHIDSIGMNEQELLFLLEVYNPELYAELKKSFSITNLFKGIYWLFLKYPHLRIHLHYVGYYLVLSPLVTKKEAEQRRFSLLVAALMAYSKAKHGEIIELENEIDISCRISVEGYNQLELLEKMIINDFEGKGDLTSCGYIQTKYFTLVGVPTLLAEEPKQLVGLGDIISVTAILGEHSKIVYHKREFT